MYLRIESFVPFETILNNSIEHFAFSILTEAGIYFLFVVVAPPIFPSNITTLFPTRFATRDDLKNINERHICLYRRNHQPF